jgi:hypothetical protein
MKKLLITLTLTLLSLVGFSQATCSGTMAGSAITAWATQTTIGDGSSGAIKICMDVNNLSGKCAGVDAFIRIYDGSGTTLYAIWTSATPAGTCFTMPICDGEANVVRYCNDGVGTQISWTTIGYTGGAIKNVCTNTTLTPNYGIDCADPIAICGTGTYPGNASGPGIQEFGCAGAPGNGQGCLLGGENNAAWYTFTALTSGTISFDISPATNKDDYDFALWGPNPTCGTLGAPLRCSFYLSKGSTGLNSTSVDLSEPNCIGPGCDGFVQEITVVAGETYILLVDGFATAIDPNYSITFSGSASLDCVALALDTTDNVIPTIEKDTTVNRTPMYYYTMEPRKIKKNDLKTYRGLYIIMYDDGTTEKMGK